MTKCSSCGLPEDRRNLCDRWDCPDLKPVCCQVFGDPVPLDLVAVRVNDQPALISRGLAERIKAMLEDIAPGGQYCG